jgi:hypothetical protein
VAQPRVGRNLRRAAGQRERSVLQHVGMIGHRPMTITVMRPLCVPKTLSELMT